MKKKLGEKEKYIIPISIIAMIVISMIVISTTYLKYIQELIDSNTLNNLSELTKQDAAKIENQISQHKKILENIVSKIEKMSNITEKEIFNIYENSIANEEFSRLAIMYEDGKTLTSDGETVDLSDEKEEFFSSYDVQISKSRKSKVDREEINIYSKKVNVEGNKIVVLLVLETDKYENIFAESIYNGRGYEYIINSNGEIIANSKKKNNGYSLFYILEMLEDSVNKEKLKEMKTKIQDYEDGNVKYEVLGKYYYTSYKYLNINDWYLVIITPGSLIAQEYNKTLKVTFGVSIVINLVALVMAIYIVISNKNKKRKLYQLAYIDQLTNLGNNNYFIGKGMEKLQEKDFKGYLIIIDIDKFKTFNKKYGRIKGDFLLQEFGNKLKTIFGENQLISRLTNDVFAILYKIKNGENDNLLERIEKINNDLSNIKIDKNEYKILVSIGICKVNREEKEMFEILDKALMAHNMAKGNYNKKYYIFDEKLEKQIIKEHDIEVNMQEGIENKEFKVFYQPKINTKTGKIEEAEALVRWEKNGNLIPPGEFIPVFEKNKFIIQLDKYIYEIVCRDLKEWKKIYDKEIKISVNISRQHLVQEEFIEEYYKIAKKYDIEPKEIELEITETTEIDIEIDKQLGITEILKKIKEKGFKISIDDFGTGYSSLNMLQDMPIDVIKIDKSFINQEKMLEIIMMMAKKLNLKTVAEGVETEKQVEILKDLEVNLLQGYYFSKPLKKIEFEKYWQNN